MELFFVTFYTANSLMKAEFWRKNLSMDKASNLYGRLIKKYTGLEVPGEYWMLHHILPDAIMYVPSYLLAAVRAAELERQLQGRFGEEWWTQREVGRHIREIMEPGAMIDLPLQSSQQFPQSRTEPFATCACHSRGLHCKYVGYNKIGSRITESCI
jgi:hypothetical protein